MWDCLGRLQEKRPSINDILATPIVKARITKFLSATLQVSCSIAMHQFSLTGRTMPTHEVPTRQMCAFVRSGGGVLMIGDQDMT